MNWFSNPISKWFWSDGKEEKDSSVSSSILQLEECDRFDSFPVNRSTTRRTIRKRRNRQHHIDREYDLIVVPPDGGCLSGSESDDSDWSIGWFEPHATEFLTTHYCNNNNNNISSSSTSGGGKMVVDDNSFAVLVPCYRNGTASRNEKLEDHVLDVIAFSEVKTSSGGNENYIEEWLSSLQNSH